MKNTFIILSAALLLTVSCAKEQPAKEISDNLVPATLSAATEQQTDAVKTSLTDKKTVIWSESDQISVLSGFGAKTSNNLFFVESVNPSDATIATFHGEIATGRDIYYALYPYSETASFNGFELTFDIPQTQTYAAGSFGPGANIAIASFESVSDPLRFRNILGVFKLSLTGAGENVGKIVLQDRSGASIWGKAKLAADEKVGTYSQELSISGGNNTLILDCSASPVTLSGTAQDFYFTAPANSFAYGFDAYVYDASDAIISHLGTAQDNGLIRSRILAMPAAPVSPALEDLSIRGTANCYMVPAQGAYRFKAVKGCGGEEVTPASVSVLWATEGVVAAPASLETIISSVSYAGGYITFNATGKPGNAVIAAFDGSGNVLWSWQIWSTGGYVKTTLYPNDSKIRMMDRNLGALGCTKEDGALCAGTIYQWGRKDPFPGAGTVAAPSQKATPPAQAGAAVKAGFSFGIKDNSIESVGTVDFAVKNPLTFITCANGFNDNDWLVGHDASLWTPDKGIYDPCPPGYRIPDKMRNWSISSSECVFDAAARGMTVFGTEWYGDPGYIYRCTGDWCGGPYDGCGEWWGCSLDAANSYYILFHMDTGAHGAGISTPKKTNAYAVRCCIDMKY